MQEHIPSNIDPHIHKQISLAKKECSKKDDIYDLTIDESAAIQLYTMESKTEQESLFYILNSTLRLADRSGLKPILPYFTLLVRALKKLPRFSGLVYRGVNGNVSSRYVKDKEIIWWGFSSCTRSVEVLSKEEFLGKSGQRTLFYIECQSGKLIENYSNSSRNDEEVLLLPATKFLVTDKKRVNRGLNIVHLREILREGPLPYKIDMIHDDGVTLLDGLDCRLETKRKTCGHDCNMWATKQCCNCSGLCLR
ncbi:unnamed protein product [Adineta steineri]|uniref:NAD(P)(+)--arginine ADP-ribosyltransferase n=1 Tax=Adineta steineri TaxID=433720 RepID=A0A819JJF6_9BILA|nr:unnamed protein product [Adineta steineri]CAF1017379.1 unnamed protein product [Adineta steineri]CAF1066599.1 unnamed protein product [Adineta steineri]CAF3789981.1 unnamed protein product [Adineta steineri]CAF3934939.1 unnamed protein product [Adineta steineri]